MWIVVATVALFEIAHLADLRSVARLATHFNMCAGQGKIRPLVVEAALGSGTYDRRRFGRGPRSGGVQLPARVGVATKAILAERAIVRIGVAIGAAFVGDGGPYFFLMAIEAFHLLVGADQRKFRLAIVIEAQFRFLFFPVVGVVALGAILKRRVGRLVDVGMATDAFGAGAEVGRVVGRFFRGRVDALFFVTALALHVDVAAG